MRFAILTLVRVGVLRAAGFTLEATGRNLQHFTVAFYDLVVGVVGWSTLADTREPGRSRGDDSAYCLNGSTNRCGWLSASDHR